MRAAPRVWGVAHPHAPPSLRTFANPEFGSDPADEAHEGEFELSSESGREAEGGVYCAPEGGTELAADHIRVGADPANVSNNAI